MKIAFGTDENLEVAQHLVAWMRGEGHEVIECSIDEPWPNVGWKVGQMVAANEADFGVVCCWTGTGVSIAANKVAGVRAALCTDAETAGGARKWNDANVLAIGLRLTSQKIGEEMISAFLNGQPDPGELSTIQQVK